MSFEYECPECDNTLHGGFGEDVHCDECGKTFETDFDYSDAMEGNLAAWIEREVKAP